MGEATRGRRIAATIAIAAVAAVAGIVGAHRADAQELDQSVSYEVGDVLVYASSTRNPSCSVTRGIVNNGTVPLRVLGSAFTDDQLDHIAPNQGTFDGDQVIQPGQRVTAVWTNHEYLPDTAAYLAWSVMLDVDVDQIGANNVEFIPACQPASEPPDTVPSTSTPPTVPATSTSTDPPPSTSAPGPVEPTPTAPGPEATTTSLCTADCGEAGVADVDICTTTPDHGVCGISLTRTELPETGRGTGHLVALGATLTALGAICLGLLPARRRLAAMRATNRTEVTS